MRGLGHQRVTATQGIKRIQRWYKGFSYKGKPSELVEQISKHIQKQGLARFLPLLRLEKGARSNKVFYFFIAVESENLGIIPSQVEQTYLFQLPFFKIPAVKGCSHFSYEQIKGMIGIAHDVQDYTNPIPYQGTIARAIYENPLDLSASGQTQILNPQAISNSSQQHEHFLYWLSASGNGTWESFKKACEALNLSEPKRILRRLKLLGHVTTSSNGSKWNVNPPSLLKAAADLGGNERTFILHGQRSARFLQALTLYGSIETSCQPRGEAPPCIRFRLPSQLDIETVIQKLSDRYPVSISTPSNLFDLESWQQELQIIQGILPSSFNLRHFDGTNFVECIFQRQTGLYQFFTQESETTSRHTFFYDQDSDRWVQGDWYGLRFLALARMGAELLVRYDSTTKKLAIPFTHRWAEVYESSLVMSSGLLPTYRDGWLIYEQIGSDVVRNLAGKLNITVEE